MPTNSFNAVVAVVDDDPNCLHALQRLLVAHGYTVEAFTSAEAYLAAAHTSLASCLVLDVQLGPGRTGIELAEEVAASGRVLPVIFVSGSADDAVKQRGHELGCVDFLGKPLLAPKLIASLRKACPPPD